MTPILLRVKELREAKRWTQAELAERSQVPQPTISRIESGKTSGVDFGVLEKLAEALNTDAALLIVHQRPLRTQYKGFELTARPFQRGDSGEWSVNVHIRRSANVRACSAGNTFPTELEAIVRSFEFGQQVVDGKIPNCSVADL
jgi:transcriptional regulator with XRE-family HTH domain